MSTAGTDLDLLRSFAEQNDAAAFAELIARHERWVFDAARRRLKDDHLADDARQSVYLVLAEKAATLVLPDAAPISAWLFHVMHHTCSGMLRTRSRQGTKRPRVNCFQTDSSRRPTMRR